MARGKQTGRILPHQHDTNDVAPIINGGTAIDAEHAAAIQHTQAKEMEDKTRKEHRRRIRHLYTWWHDNYIDYFENGTCALSDDEKKEKGSIYTNLQVGCGRDEYIYLGLLSLNVAHDGSVYLHILHCLTQY